MNDLELDGVEILAGLAVRGSLPIEFGEITWEPDMYGVPRDSIKEIREVESKDDKVMILITLLLTSHDPLLRDINWNRKEQKFEVDH